MSKISRMCLALTFLLAFCDLSYCGVWQDSNSVVEETAVLYANPGKSPEPLAFSVSSHTNVAEYDEAWVDYSLNSAIEPAAMVFELDLMARSPYTRRYIQVNATAVEAKYLPVPVLELAAGSEAWALKDRKFFFSKLFDAKPDGKWRYAMLGNILMVQARLRVPIAGLAAMDVYLPPDADIVGLNLRVASSERWPLERIVESPVLPAQDITFGREKFRRIDLKRLLLEQLPGCRTPYLKEISVFIRQAAAAPPIRNPVARVLLQRLSYDLDLPEEGGRILKMQSRTKLLSEGKRRLVVQLEGAKAFGDAFVTGGRLRTVYTRGASPTGINIGKVSLVMLAAPASPPPAVKKGIPAESTPDTLGIEKLKTDFLLVFSALAPIFFFVVFARRFLAPRLPTVIKDFLAEGYRIYFLLAAALLLPAALITLTGRTRAADPAAAVAWLCMAMGTLSIGKDIFFPKK
jgi:hypothetical protein